MTLGLVGGHFILDPTTLEVYYSSTGAISCSTPIPCLDFCPDNTENYSKSKC